MENNGIIEVRTGAKVDKSELKKLDDFKAVKMKPAPKPEEPQPQMSDIISFISKYPAVKPVTPSKRVLSVNGRVLQDKITTYLKRKGISSSLLKEAEKTLLHYYCAKNEKIPKKEEKHFELGTFAHMAFLEPKKFKKVVVEPKASRASRAGVLRLIEFYTYAAAGIDESVLRFDFEELDNYTIEELKARLNKLESHCTHTVVKEDHKIIIDLIRRHYYSYGGGIIPRLLKGAMSEVSMYGIDESTGLNVKIRPDALQFKENIGVDAVVSFKTTSAKSLKKFIYDVAAFNYQLSEGMYQKVTSDVTGRKFNTTIMIVLQTVAPYLPAVFLWSNKDIEVGKYKYHSALESIKIATDANKYPGFDSFAESGNRGIIEMVLPDWTKKELHPVNVND